MSSKVQIEICGATGLRNVGTFFSPPQHLINHKVPAVLVTSATGCCASFYHRFCNYLAEQGCPVYVYDYVGVGKSAWPSADAEQEDNDNCDGRVEYLRRIEHVNIQSWAADLDIVLKWFNDQVQPAIGQDRREIVYVSHSVGGHLLPLCSNRNLVSRCLLVSANIAYWGVSRHPFKLRLLWLFGVPLFAKIYGYFPIKRYQLMEDLPVGVVKQWAHWGHYPEYMCSDPKLKPLYRSFDKPLLMLSFDDDELACRKGFEDYFNLVGESGNKSAKQQTMIHLKPKSNQTLVGHNGFFLEQNREMWKWVLPWIVEGRQPQSAETIGMSRL